MLYHCRMWCYAIGIEAVVLRSWCVTLRTVCPLVFNWHQVGTSLLIYMMHGHTYIKYIIQFIPPSSYAESVYFLTLGSVTELQTHTKEKKNTVFVR